MTKLRVFEAFSGIGTQTMGLSRANIDHDVVAISEIDSYAIRSYEAIHGSVNKQVTPSLSMSSLRFSIKCSTKKRHSHECLLFFVFEEFFISTFSKNFIQIIFFTNF